VNETENPRVTRSRRVRVASGVSLCILVVIAVFVGGQYLVMHVARTTVQNAVSRVPPALAAAREKAKVPLVDGSEVVVGEEQVALITGAFRFTPAAEPRPVIVFEGYWTNQALVPNRANEQLVGLLHTDRTGRQIIVLRKRTSAPLPQSEVGLLSLSGPNLLIHVYEIAE